MGCVFGANRPRRLALEEAAIEDVVPAAGVGLEAQREIEQRADLADDRAAAAGGRINAGQQLQQRALAGPVAADDSQPVAFRDGQLDVLQGLDVEGRLLRRRNSPWSRYSLKLIRPNRRT